jgi:hypothetical protein
MVCKGPESKVIAHAVGKDEYCSLNLFQFLLTFAEDRIIRLSLYVSCQQEIKFFTPLTTRTV